MSAKLSKAQSAHAWRVAERITEAVLKMEVPANLSWNYYRLTLFAKDGDFLLNPKIINWLEENNYVMAEHKNRTVFNEIAAHTKNRGSNHRLKSVVQWLGTFSQTVELQRKRLGAVIAAGHKRRQNTRRKIDIDFRMRGVLRGRLREALKGNAKSSKMESLLGCSIPEFRNHLERQFTPEMTWENYGHWHVDHIRPCCSFDLSKPEDQRECFHFSNMQPLWAMDNFKKNGKWKGNQ